MKVLLMDLDKSSRRRAFPNLALMKLSAYHKAKGDEVFFNFPLCQADRTYASCVFTWHSQKVEGLDPDAVLGGSGIDLKEDLPPEVEHIMPDYQLYPNVDFSMGFTSRGCLRSCPWCLVPEKEGTIKAVASVHEFWEHRHKRLLLLDNNLLAAPNWRTTLAELILAGVRTDFNQGLDIRLVTDEVADYLRQVNAASLRFAYDDLVYEKQVRQGIEVLVKAGIPMRHLSFYVLVGFPGDETAIERMKLLASYGVDVYPMIYKGQDGKEPTVKSKWDGTIFWHGGRQNIRKFLRVVGKLD